MDILEKGIKRTAKRRVARGRTGERPPIGPTANDVRWEAAKI